MRINTDSDLKQQIEALIVLEPRFQRALDLVGLPSLQKNESGFTALYQVLVAQQLSVAAADSIWNKLHSAQLTDAERILDADENCLRSCGLSKQKVRYIKALAEANIDYDELPNLPREQVVKILTAVLGIGEWTAEIYLLFSLHDSDTLAAKDLALQEAIKQLFELEERPNDRQLKQMALSWSPYRSAAAHLLWAYYRVLKNRAGIVGN